MSEYSDYTPSSWSKGHDFKKAKKDYDSHRDRSYGEARKKNTKSDDLIPKSIKVTAEYFLGIINDVTGSMGEWPATIFAKYPYLDHEAKVYLGKKIQYLLGATGDARGDKYPVQITKPGKGKDIKDRLLSLIDEQGGGANDKESYELLALYFARKVFMPNLKHKPILIFIGDEAPYDYVNRAWAQKYFHINLQKEMSTEKIFKELKRKFSVYLIKKPYGCSRQDAMSAEDRRIYEKWVTLLGEDKIAILEDPKRVVDIIFAILARETNRMEYCIEEFNHRQGKDEDYEKKKEIFESATQSIFAPLRAQKKTVRKKDPKGKKMKKLM